VSRSASTRTSCSASGKHADPGHPSPLSPAQHADRPLGIDHLVKKSDPTYPVDSCWEDDSHYGFGYGADLANGGFRRTFPLVDQRTGEVTWLRGTRGSKRLERMRPVVKTP